MAASNTACQGIPLRQLTQARCAITSPAATQSATTANVLLPSTSGTSASTLTSNATATGSGLTSQNASSASASEGRGVWSKCNNIYMVLAVAVGLVMTFIGFKVSIDAYRLSVWTSQKDYVELCLELVTARVSISPDCEEALKIPLSPPPGFKHGKRAVPCDALQKLSFDSSSVFGHKLLFWLGLSVAASFTSAITRTYWGSLKTLAIPVRPQHGPLATPASDDDQDRWVPTSLAKVAAEASNVTYTELQSHLRRRRIARYQPEESDNWERFKKPTKDLSDHESDLPLMIRSGFSGIEDHDPSKGDPLTEIWLPMKNYLPIIPYLETVYAAPLSLNECGPTQKEDFGAQLRQAARLIKFYAYLVQRSLNSQVRFLVVRLNEAGSSSGPSYYVSPRSGWVKDGTGPGPESNKTEKAEWDALERLLTRKIRGSITTKPDELWSLMLPSACWPQLWLVKSISGEVSAHEISPVYMTDAECKASLQESDELITQLTGKYKAPSQFNTISFMDHREVNGHVIVTVKCSKDDFYKLERRLNQKRKSEKVAQPVCLAGGSGW